MHWILSLSRKALLRKNRKLLPLILRPPDWFGTAMEAVVPHSHALRSSPQIRLHQSRQRFEIPWAQSQVFPAATPRHRSAGRDLACRCMPRPPRRETPRPPRRGAPSPRTAASRRRHACHRLPQVMHAAASLAYLLHVLGNILICGSRTAEGLGVARRYTASGPPVAARPRTRGREHGGAHSMWTVLLQQECGTLFMTLCHVLWPGLHRPKPPNRAMAQGLCRSERAAHG